MIWLVLVCLFELCCLLLVALSPLPELHLSASPIATAMPWTLLPFQFLHTLIGSHYWLSPLLLGLTLLGLLGTYLWAIRTTCQRASTDRMFFLLLGSVGVFGFTLLLQPMLFSDDVFTYIFAGRMLAVYHVNPLNTAPIQFPTDPYLQWVITGRNTANIYGSLWLCIVSLLVGLGRSPVATLLLFKGVAFAAHLLNCMLIWAILGKVAPVRRLIGTLLYAWNPLALIELAGNGHSEGVLLFLLLVATWFYIRGKGYRIGTLVVFGLAISANLIALLLAPLYLWFDVRTERCISWGLGWRTLLMLLPALIIELPFWRGASTFFAIMSAVDMQHFVYSPLEIFAGPLRYTFQLVAQLLHFPSFLQPVISADITLRAASITIFAVIYSHLFSHVHHAPSCHTLDAEQEMKYPGFDVLLNSWSIAIFWYLILVSGWFWPWYVLWTLWTVVLLPSNAFASTVLVLSGTALLIYPLLGFPQASLAAYQASLIFGIPLLYFIIGKHRSMKRAIGTDVSDPWSHSLFARGTR